MYMDIVHALHVNVMLLYSIVNIIDLCANQNHDVQSCSTMHVQLLRALHNIVDYLCCQERLMCSWCVATMLLFSLTLCYNLSIDYFFSQII